MGKNVIPQLENQGYRVDYKGVGKIKNQFPEIKMRKLVRMG